MAKILLSSSFLIQGFLNKIKKTIAIVDKTELKKQMFYRQADRHRILLSNFKTSLD